MARVEPFCCFVLGVAVIAVFPWAVWVQQAWIGCAQRESLKEAFEKEVVGVGVVALDEPVLTFQF